MNPSNWKARPLLRLAGAALVAALFLGMLLWLNGQGGGRTLMFALSAGAALGLVLQRSRFCFYCHIRDYFDPGPQGPDARGLLAILLALGLGTTGMHLVYAGWVPNPAGGRLPAEAHIGPVSWALGLAGLVFGLGMVISGSCISAHWYRLGEGSPTAPFALIGSAFGFGLGLHSWNPLYSLSIAEGRAWWLPQWLGHAGSAGLSLLLLAGLAAWWTRRPRPTHSQAATSAPPEHFGQALRWIFTVERWPFWVGGLGVAWLSTLVLLRLRPLGVTAALGSGVRELAAPWQLAPERLEGLDQLRGCTAPLASSLVHAPNSWLVLGLVLGAWWAALLAGQFRPRWPGRSDISRGLLGGTLLGWGAMTGLGCTVGNLLSGTMAGALSGWVFGASMLGGIVLGLRCGWARARPV